MLARGHAIKDEHGEWARMVGTHTDLTRLKETEAALRDSERRLQKLSEELEEQVSERTKALQSSEARFRALANHAPELISEFDEKGLYTFANASFYELLGLDPEHLIGKPPQELIHPDDLPESRRGMRHALAQEATSRALHRLRHSDGSWRWFDNTGRAYRASDGQLRFVSIGRDVTEAKRLEDERRKLDEHLRQAERRESLHVLAGGVAHDFNNLLAVILGNVEVLENEEPAHSDAGHRLARIRSAGRYAQALTRQLGAYVGDSVRHLHPLDLSELIRESEPLLRASVAGPCRLEIDAGTSPHWVEGDATELRQVLMNLTINASDALTEDGGTIRVTTRNVPADEVERESGDSDSDGRDWVALEVADDGPGMDEATRAHAHEPFYTTKAPGRGLGLAVVFGIATAHEGHLVLESVPGEGCTFRLLLPTTTRREDPVPVPKPRSELEPRVGRVLVVDDDEGVRELEQLFLERAGFVVELASGGTEALERLRKPPAPDCVVLDLAMPDVAGRQVLVSLRRSWPTVPVVVVTGFVGTGAKRQLGDHEVYAVLAKPFEPDVLVQTVTRAVAGPAADGDPSPRDARGQRPPPASSSR
jgi:PAS domain S-box-containing protein